jgi:hypothetical protein
MQPSPYNVAERPRSGQARSDAARALMVNSTRYRYIVLLRKRRRALLTGAPCRALSGGCRAAARIAEASGAEPGATWSLLVASRRFSSLLVASRRFSAPRRFSPLVASRHFGCTRNLFGCARRFSGKTSFLAEHIVYRAARRGSPLGKQLNIGPISRYLGNEQHEQEAAAASSGSAAKRKAPASAGQTYECKDLTIGIC